MRRSRWLICVTALVLASFVGTTATAAATPSDTPPPATPSATPSPTPSPSPAASEAVAPVPAPSPEPAPVPPPSPTVANSAQAALAPSPQLAAPGAAMPLRAAPQLRSTPVGPAVGGPGFVTVSTVPALAGVHLLIAGRGVVTGRNGTATVAVGDLTGLSKQVALASTAVGADTVALGKVMQVAAAPHSRTLEIGLDVTSPVRVNLVAGSSGISPAHVKTVRIRSINGQTLTIDPAGSTVVDLLSRKTRFERGHLVAHTITWQAERLSTTGGITATTPRTPFDPLSSSVWTIPIEPASGVVQVSTIPAMPGVVLTVGGTTVTTAANGTADAAVADLNGIRERVALATTSAGDDTVSIRHVSREDAHARGVRRIVVALDVARPVTLHFVGRGGAVIDPLLISRVVLHGEGKDIVLNGQQIALPVVLAMYAPTLKKHRWTTRDVVYTLSSVQYSAGDAVFTGRQSFTVAAGTPWTISLSLFTTTIQVRDALFGGPLSMPATLTGPGSTTSAIRTDRNGAATVSSMVRGMYQLKVHGAAAGATNDILVSRDSVADVRIITPLDVVVALAALLLAAALLITAGWFGPRWRGRRREPASETGASREKDAVIPRWIGRPRPLKVTMIAAIFAAVLLSTSTSQPAAGATTAPAASAPSSAPVFAYFYQWFTPASWTRAKMDYPLIGKYSSSDPAVLRTQIEQAQSAGVGGFLTSWKSTAQLNANLQLLVDQAGPAHLDLGVVYEALDFNRNPLPVSTVQADMTYLVDRWGSGLRSHAFGKPIIIWTGTNSYTPAEVAAVHQALGGRALLLAASKDVGGYEQIAGDVDGEAYYWSSADPTAPNTAQKLAAMSAAVHAHHGIWIAPAASGFDGTTLAHTRVIDRAGGRTLTRSLQNAYASKPDAVGVISWNEWSENTYIEPGGKYGAEELNALRDFLGAGHGSPSAGAPAQNPPAEPTRGPSPAASPSTATAHAASRGAGMPQPLLAGAASAGVLALVAGIGIGFMRRRAHLQRKER